jgi:hypothetical protein
MEPKKVKQKFLLFYSQKINYKLKIIDILLVIFYISSDTYYKNLLVFV